MVPEKGFRGATFPSLKIVRQRFLIAPVDQRIDEKAKGDLKCRMRSRNYLLRIDWEVEGYPPGRLW